jgi:hypothetical protein
MVKSQKRKAMTTSLILINQPKAGVTLHGSALPTSGTAPADYKTVTGTLSVSGGASVEGNTLTAPPLWSVFFDCDALEQIMPTDGKVYDVTLRVDANGDSKEVSFKFKKQQCITAANSAAENAKASKAKARKAKASPTVIVSVTSITPDPPLHGTTQSASFTSSGEAPPGPLYAFLMQPGGQPIMGSLIQFPEDPSDQFVFMWQNVPPSSLPGSYTIYYQTFGNPTLYATDNDITVGS